MVVIKFIFLEQQNHLFIYLFILFFFYKNCVFWYIKYYGLITCYLRMWLLTGIIIYDSISNYGIFVNLGHFTGLCTDIMIYDAIPGYAISVKFRLFHTVSAWSINVHSWLANIYFNIRGHESLQTCCRKMCVNSHGLCMIN